MVDVLSLWGHCKLIGDTDRAAALSNRVVHEYFNPFFILTSACSTLISLRPLAFWICSSDQKLKVIGCQAALKNRVCMEIIA